MFCPLDDKVVIHIPKPQFWSVGGHIDGLGFKLFHDQVGHKGAEGVTHGCPMQVFIILTLEAEIGIF